jgi:hypothetical protein
VECIKFFFIHGSNELHISFVRLIFIITHPIGKDWLRVSVPNITWVHFPLSQHKIQSFVSDITNSIDLFSPAIFTEMDIVMHKHAHIINAQHNCLIAPFSNASKQFLWVILPLNIICCCVI